MFFNWLNRNRTVKELRKNQGLTARETAVLLKMDTVDVLQVDNLRLKEVPEPMKSRITPLLRGDRLDKIPW